MVENAMKELLSIDLSNYCSKRCSFCYNHSNPEGAIMWKPAEVIDFASDCVKNGIKAVSLGGGEPFEYEGIFEIMAALYPITYLSVTSNGLPLLKRDVFEKLLKHSPDKIHLTIHNPDNQKEVIRVIEQVVELSKTKIKPGVNLLISSYCIAECQEVYAKLLETLQSNQIILIPKRFGDTPTVKQMASVANGKPFQSPSCLLKCEIPSKFVSVSWDKKVNHCSYAGGKEPLRALDYAGLVDALKRVVFSNCSKRINLHSQTE